MFQRFFENKASSIFEKNHSPQLLRYMHSNDPHWQSGFHAHKKETELLYVMQGKITVTIDSFHYIAPEGSIIAIERESIHAIKSDLQEPATTYAFGIYDYKVKGLEETKIMPTDTNPVVTSVQYRDLLLHTINGISSVTQHRSGYTETLVCDAMASSLAGILTMIFYENFKNASPKNSSSPKHFFIQNILKFLDEHYKQKITLQDLASRFNVSVSYISHEFSKEYNISPINYVIKRRITEAKLMLTNTDLSLSEVSFRVGYDNVDHFTKLFVNHVDCTPSEYRKRFRQNIKV